MTQCPHCRREVGPEHFACVKAAKAGAAGKGKAKARTSEQARRAVQARWGKKVEA